MALVKCPECGSEVSEYAEQCPKCGFGVKQHFEEQKEKELAEKKAAEKKAEELRLQEENEKRNKEIHDKFFGTKKKKILTISAIILILVLLAGGIKLYQEYTYDYKMAKSYVDSCMDYMGRIESSTDLYGEPIHIIEFLDYDSFSLRETYSKLSARKQDKLNRYIQNTYGLSFNELDDKCLLLGFDSYDWEYYGDHMNDDDFYLALRDKIQNKKDEEIGDVEVTDLSMNSTGDSYHITGSVTNTTQFTVSFVKVKVKLKDENGNVLDTDSTYAVGDEGLNPGESSTFECYMDYVAGTESCGALVYDFMFD